MICGAGLWLGILQKAQYDSKYERVMGTWDGKGVNLKDMEKTANTRDNSLIQDGRRPTLNNEESTKASTTARRVVYTRRKVQSRPSSAVSSISSSAGTDTHRSDKRSATSRPLQQKRDGAGDLKNFVDVKTREEREKLLKGNVYIKCYVKCYIDTMQFYRAMCYTLSLEINFLFCSHGLPGIINLWNICEV